MSSLVNSREFEGKIVDASEVELALVRQENGQHAIEPSRYRAIVDSLGNECGHVSHSSYTLVTNTELLSAFDLVADSLGLEIEPKDAHYAGKNGKAQYSFYCPQYEIQPTGDPSKWPNQHAKACWAIQSF
jgi:hypothetical protein